MKRDKKQIDDFIKRNLPRLSREEVDEAGDRVLSRLHRDMQDRIDAFRLQAFEPDDTPEWLKRDIGWNRKKGPLLKDEYMALRIVCLLGDQADRTSVFKRAKDLFSDVVAACMVLYGLDSLEQRGYLKRESYEFPRKGSPAEQPYIITPDGQAALEPAERAEREASELKADGLEDLA